MFAIRLLPLLVVVAFYQVDKSTCKLYVPIGSKDTYATAEGWKEIQNIEESSKEPILTFSYYCLPINFRYGTLKMLLRIGNKNLKSFIYRYEEL